MHVFFMSAFQQILLKNKLSNSHKPLRVFVPRMFANRHNKDIKTCRFNAFLMFCNTLLRTNFVDS